VLRSPRSGEKVILRSNRWQENSVNDDSLAAQEALRPTTFKAGSLPSVTVFAAPNPFELLRKDGETKAGQLTQLILRHLSRASQVQGPTRCGSGLSTILLASWPQVALPLWNIYRVAGAVKSAAERFSLDINILAAPLVDYGGYLV